MIRLTKKLVNKPNRGQQEGLFYYKITRSKARALDKQRFRNNMPLERDFLSHSLIPFTE